MASPKPATQKGLNQQLPQRLADQLSRALRGMSTKVRAILLADTVQAIEDDDQVAFDASLEAIALLLATDYSNTKLREAAQPIGERVNKGHSTAFFAGVAALVGVKIVGSDIPSEQFANIQALPRSTGPGGPTILAPQVNVGPTQSQAEFVSGVELFVGKLRGGITDGIEFDVERERLRQEEDTGAVDLAILAAAMAALWRKRGPQSDIRVNRETETGIPVLVTVRNHLDMIVIDQTSKLNAALNDSRMTAASIDSFVWETRKDNRVRPSHRALQSTTHTWQAGAGGIYPGEPPGCRCWARAVANPTRVMKDGRWVLIAAPDAGLEAAE